MIIGMFSDLHSNLPALESMVEKFGSKIDIWLSAGDSVGIFPQVNETLNLLQRMNVHMVCGDHEKLLLSGEDMVWSYTGNQALQEQRESITKENLYYLSSLPEKLDLKIDGLNIRLIHDVTGVIRTGKEKNIINSQQLNILHPGVDYLLAGHTHMATMLYTDTLIYLNPGSSGFPKDLRHQTGMLMLDTSSGFHEFITFDFDRDRLRKAIIDKNYNPKLLHYLDNNFRWI
ncbi:metallophosphoesterase family protein [Aeromonas sp. NJAU223]|uniref:metallophosphoesterase family protein n=1 Tax=Aeromonas sp. NJAU223 TaxID=3115650 RepID=UPI003DA90408